MSGDRKQEVCDKFANMERQIGPGGMTRLYQCGGDFPVAFEQATVLCGPGGLRPGSIPGSCDITSQPDRYGRRKLHGSDHEPAHSSEEMCNVACAKIKAQVHLNVCACLYV